MPVNLTLPTDGGSPGVWGGILNTALGALQTFVNSLETTVSGKVPLTRSVTAGTGLTGGGDLTADRTLSVLYGTASGTAAAGNDGRLSDSRTPIEHAATHSSAGSDPVTVAQSQVSGLSTTLAGKSDAGHAHAAGDITSGTLPVARGGTGVTTLAALQSALGLGTGASIYRVSTSTTDTGSNTTRTMTGWDTTRNADSGYTVNLGAGTITVPADGIYAIAGHARMSTGTTAQCALTLTDGTSELLRSTFAAWSSLQDLAIAGVTDHVTAGTALSLQFFSSASVSLVGNASGSYYMFRVVRIG